MNEGLNIVYVLKFEIADCYEQNGNNGYTMVRVNQLKMAIVCKVFQSAC